MTYIDADGFLALTAQGTRKCGAWMASELAQNRADYLDDCDEINCTMLAEAAAEALQLYRNPGLANSDDEAAQIPEDVFDLAYTAKEYVLEVVE